MDESDRLSTAIALQDLLANHDVGSDLLLSTMVAAASCSRRFSVCTPFPKDLYTKHDSEKDLRGLCNDLVALPSTRQLQDFDCLSRLDERSLQLLRWLLLHNSRRRVLHPVSITELHHLLRGRCSGWDKLFTCEWLKPSAVFKLEQGVEQQLTDPVLAFHGTSFENLYSILQNGLLNLTGTLLQRTGANYGDGIYLSTNFDVAFHFSVPADAWSNSSLGNRLRCLLVCEVDKQYLADQGQLANLHPSSSRVVSAGSQLPETYLLVKSKAAVNISHIVIWCDQPAMHSVKAGSRVNLCALVVVLYVVMMVVLGLTSNKTRWKYH